MSLTALKYDNVFALRTSKVAVEKFQCLKALIDDQKLWSHINMNTMHELANKELL